ncbi:GntR family transcriptional regulator [Actinopolymorpha pittospori]|uniref:DNA-binding GntR family transcriptional regulator n=1 Tax=Actinopolymorpha pittospori TaxID=648752 RepID=A0A927MVG4_9ACTN|nr:DNA-binding GntR family transcriptional regulator [Actinopolymorpha pittospori]
MRVSKDDPRPPYAQLAEDLRRAIERGKYSAGQRLPSVRELAEQYDVSRNTIQRALDTLKSEGVVESHPPLGVFVRSTEADATRHSPEYLEIMRLLSSLQSSVDQLSDRVDAIERGTRRPPAQPPR